MKFYMFRTVPLSIIRSLFTVHSAVVYVIQVCRQLSSRTILSASSRFYYKVKNACSELLYHLLLYSAKGCTPKVQKLKTYAVYPLY